MKNILDITTDFLFNSNPLILVAGKDANNHRNYQSIITGAGYRYTGRYKLEKGYDLTAWGSPELIIWDLNVNETANSQVLFNIKTHYAVPVLVFTDDKYAMSAAKAIADPPHYSTSLFGRDSIEIQKPVTTEQLLALISQYLYEKTSPLIADEF